MIAVLIGGEHVEDTIMREEIERATAIVVGKRLWTCRRAADMATFHFGSGAKTTDYYGRPSEVGECALHVQCAWRIAHDDQIVVASCDLYYPAEYYDANEDVPSEFDWDRDPNRRDKLLTTLFQNETRQLIVQEIQVGEAGSLHIVMIDGYCLDVFPDVSLNCEYWRLFRPGLTSLILWLRCPA